MISKNQIKLEKIYATHPILTCHFDGSCDPNPGGPMGMGVFIYKNGEEYHFDSKGRGENPNNTSNVAEYLAFEMILDFLLEQPKSIIQIKGDSMLVFKQMTNRWRILYGSYVPYARNCIEKLEEVRKLHNFKLIQFNPFVTWIPREENAYADDLSKEGAKKNIFVDLNNFYK